jgi:lipoate-protein ligase A
MPTGPGPRRPSGGHGPQRGDAGRRRGWFRAAGGPAAAVTLTIDGDRLGEVEVTAGGVAPDDAARFAAALAGARTGAATDELRALLPAPGRDDGAPDVRDAVAAAVRRAVVGASDWDDLVLEVVREPAVTPWHHMALDQAMAEAVVAGERGLTLRFWEWDRAVVVLGSFQSVGNEVDLDGAARHGVTLVRRCSGGGAMFVQPEKTITFSLLAPAALVAGLSFAASYAFLDAWAVDALRGLGADVRYVPLNDIASPRGKVAGAAQKRFAGGAVLHHVTMAYDIDSPTMLEVLRTFRPHVSPRGTKSAQKHVDPLRRQVDLPRPAVVDALEAHARAALRGAGGATTAAERERAEELVATRYATAAWLERVP